MFSLLSSVLLHEQRTFFHILKKRASHKHLFRMNSDVLSGSYLYRFFLLWAPACGTFLGSHFCFSFGVLNGNHWDAIGWRGKRNFIVLHSSASPVLGHQEPAGLFYRRVCQWSSLTMTAIATATPITTTATTTATTRTDYKHDYCNFNHTTTLN